MLNQERFLILRIPGRHDVNGGGTFPPYWYDRHYLTMSALRTAGVLPLCDYKSPATGWPSVKGCKPSSQSSQSQSSSWQGYNKQGNCWDGTLSHCLCHSTGFRLKRWKKKKKPCVFNLRFMIISKASIFFSARFTDYFYPIFCGWFSFDILWPFLSQVVWYSHVKRSLYIKDVKPHVGHSCYKMFSLLRNMACFNILKMAGFM